MVLPIETYVYCLSRLRYLSAAANGIVATPPFAPDGKSALYCSEQVALCQQAFSGLVTKFNAANEAHGAMTVTSDLGYKTAIAVYASMKSLYRTEVSALGSITAIPNADPMPLKTLERMNSLDDLWTTLPNVPGTSGPMVVGELTSAVFGAMGTEFHAKLRAANLAAALYSGELAGFHAKLAIWNNFVSAGIEQGQALYAEGTGPRAFIDHIPVAPSTQPPDQAVITSATSPAAGTAQLAFGADHATSFKVWRKGPGQSVFVEVGDVLLPGEFTDTGLAAGTYEYYATGVNSRGTGPASTPVSVLVAAEAAA